MPSAAARARSAAAVARPSTARAPTLITSAPSWDPPTTVRLEPGRTLIATRTWSDCQARAPARHRVGWFPAVRGTPGRDRRSFVILGIFLLGVPGPPGADENGDFSPACPTTPILIRALVDDPRHWDGAGQGRYRRRCTTGRMPGADPRERSPPAELAPGGRSGRALPATDRRVAVRPAQRIRPRLHPLFVSGCASSRGALLHHGAQRPRFTARPNTISRQDDRQTNSGRGKRPPICLQGAERVA